MGQQLISYWRRGPFLRFDIGRLLPGTLPRGKRFETVADANDESIRSEQVLLNRKSQNRFATYLIECRGECYHCEKTYCPRCARAFRRYLVGELLRLNDEFGGSVKISTVLLETVLKGKLNTLDIASYDQMLRKRLLRSGLSSVPIIGGIEIMYRADKKVWILHLNLAFFGGEPAAIAAFEETFSRAEFYRPVHTVDLKNPAQQFSYLLKFTTYHRPFQQTGPRKAPAKPLNPDDHYELVSWMAQHEFTDHLFLFNARRYGPSIRLNNKDSRKA